MVTRKTLHTLNARGHMMLEVMRDHFSISSVRMFHEIQAMKRDVENVLAKKNISYDKLKSALVPDRKKQEIALVFNSYSIDNNWYGHAVFEKLIPLLDRKSNHSILVGDYLGDNYNQQSRYEAMLEAVKFNKPIEYRYSSQFFIVYINNLTPAMTKRIDEGLADWAPYVGFADMTFGSLFKFLLSTMLCNLCIKHGQIIIQGHEDDLSDDRDINMCGYPFDEHGYLCRSLPSYLVGIFLSYKIERPVLKGCEVDTEFSLNAISETPLPLEIFAVEVEAAKLAYIKTEKGASLARAGLKDVTSEELCRLIRQRISESYIYNLTADEIHGTTKFNVIIELPSDDSGPTRLLAALEYQAARRVLRLITLY